MTGRPRRGPVSPEQRLKDNLRTQANGSAYGQTPNSRRVVESRGAAGAQYGVASTEAAALPRIAVGYRVDLSGISPGASGHFNPTDWTFTEEDSSHGILEAVGGGSIYFNRSGVYAVHVWLTSTDIGAADPTCSLQLFCDVIDPFATSFGCGLRGGDAATRPPFASTSRTYWNPGAGSSGGIEVGFSYANFDKTNITNQPVFEVHVQALALD